MEQKERRGGNAVIILLLLVVGISIGYAALTTTLMINGNSTIKKASWDVHFANVNVKTGSVAINTTAGEKAATITDTAATIIDYKITLLQPGDFYEFTVDVVNGGSLDAAISAVPTITDISDHNKYLEYSVVWDDTNEAPAKNDTITGGQSRPIRVRVAYKTDVNSIDLPGTDKTLELKFSMNFIQAR